MYAPAPPRRPCLLLISAALLVSPAAYADGVDVAGAREQLKIGYGLKLSGRCPDAMPHLVESERLDPQPKTLLNLAECEDTLGRLVEAEAHLAEARDRAHVEARPELGMMANERLTSLERRVPRLTVNLSSGAPLATQVFRDGVMLGAASLGTPLPVNPGQHVVTAKVEGHREQRVTVTVAETESRALTIAPSDEGTDAPSASSPAVPGEATGASPGEDRVLWPAITALAVGGAGIVVGSVFGARAFSQWSDARQQCTPGDCGPASTAVSTRDSASTSATISDVGFVVGGVGVAAGIVLWVFAPRRAPSVAGMSVSPTLGRASAGLDVGGSF